MGISPIYLNDISKLSPLQPEGWVNIIPIFDFYIHSSFCFPIKVTVNDEIIGLGCTIIHNDVAWLAHIIVDPAYRRKGIGQKITQTLVEIAKENNCSIIYLIATVLGEPVYKKVGFETETEYLVYKNITRKDWEISPYIYPYKEEYREQICILDKKTSGEDRLMHLEEHFRNSYIYRNNDMVEGYYMPTLGEGLIIAETETAGIELLKLYLKSNDRVVIPQENHAAGKFLEEIGTSEIIAIKRMRLGKEQKIEFSNIYNRIAGNVG